MTDKFDREELLTICEGATALLVGLDDASLGCTLHVDVEKALTMLHRAKRLYALRNKAARLFDVLDAQAEEESLCESA